MRRFVLATRLRMVPLAAAVALLAHAAGPAWAAEPSEVGRRAQSAGQHGDTAGDRLRDSAKGFGGALLDGIRFIGRTVADLLDLERAGRAAPTSGADVEAVPPRPRAWEERVGPGGARIAPDPVFLESATATTPRARAGLSAWTTQAPAFEAREASEGIAVGLTIAWPGLPDGGLQDGRQGGGPAAPAPDPVAP